MDEQEKGSPQNDLSGALENLFSDPQARERFEKIVGVLKENSQKEWPSNLQKEEKTHTMSSGTDGLAAILSNPAVMENLPSLLSGMKPIAQKQDVPKTPEDRRRDLLLALKPFLSQDRGNAVDLILQLSRLGAVLRMMQ